MANDDPSREHFEAVTRECEDRLAAARTRLAGGNSEAIDDIVLELVIIGSRKSHVGEFAAALAAYEEALGIQRDIAAQTPDEPLAERDVSMTLDGIGHTRRQTGDLTGARRAYEESLGIRRAQAAREPADDDWQRYISWSLDYLGDVSLQGHDPDGARAAYEESLAIRRAYVARFPDRTYWSRDLAQSRDRIGHLDEVLGNAETAERLQTEADEICRDVRERDRRSGRAVS